MCQALSENSKNVSTGSSLFTTAPVLIHIQELKLKTFPNQKAWKNKEIHLLLKAGNAHFRSGDQETYTSSSINLRKGRMEDKYKYKMWIENNINNPDPRHMWHCIPNIH